jgi:hypothetical protein
MDEMSFPQLRNDFCHLEVGKFAFRISELFKKCLHQVDSECQLVDLLSGVMAINYYCIHHCGIQKSSE